MTRHCSLSLQHIYVLNATTSRYAYQEERMSHSTKKTELQSISELVEASWKCKKFAASYITIDNVWFSEQTL